MASIVAKDASLARAWANPGDLAVRLACAKELTALGDLRGELVTLECTGKLTHRQLERHERLLRDERAHLSRGFGSDVEKDRLAWINSGALVRRNQVYVPDACDGEHRPLRTDNHPTLIDQCLIEPAAEHLHTQVSVRRNAADHSSEFIHVRINHHARAGRALNGDY